MSLLRLLLVLLWAALRRERARQVLVPVAISATVVSQCGTPRDLPD